MLNPTLFGFNGNRAMVGGEAGAEAILPLEQFYTRLNRMLDSKLQAINNMTKVYVDNKVFLDGDEIASRTETRVSDKMADNYKKRR